MTKACPAEKPITGQTLFLGASVLSFNTNMGWGRGSSLTVELIEDTQPVSCYRPPNNIDGTPIPHFATSRKSTPNHYHTCTGNDCYVDEKGNDYTSTGNNASKFKLVPGKVYYQYVDGADMFHSYYWYDGDPGFFGTGTRIDNNGNFDSTTLYTYDIIGVPVWFKLDNFVFGGIITSWEKNISATGPVTYTVNIESFDRLLDNAYIIVDNYAGSVFSKATGNLGGPKNFWVPDVKGVETTGPLRDGSIHNVFNVYGFLESLNIDYFGGAKKNDDGISAKDIINCLQVLTATLDTNSLTALQKNMYSPFGRLLTKSITQLGFQRRGENFIARTVPVTVDFKRFGVIPPVAYKTGKDTRNRNVFTLDLSDVPQPPDTFKIAGNNGIISILDFIRQITDALGRDFTTSLVPSFINSLPIYTIKVKTIDRTSTPPVGQLASVIKGLTDSGFEVTQSSYGKEANQNTSKVVYIGANQQRLLQAKSYRLAYSQTSYIYNPALKKFVNFRRFGTRGKVRMPLFLSTRNPVLSANINGGSIISSIINADEALADKIRGDADRTAKLETDWRDDNLSETILRGNYLTSMVDSRPDSAASIRFIPLYEDTICPFFGYKLDGKIELQTDDSSNIFRYMRPVWLDSWTGQLAVYFENNEIPTLSIGSMVSLYSDAFSKPALGGPVDGLTRETPVSQQEQSGNASSITTSIPPRTNDSVTDSSVGMGFGFLITETEFRAASNFDSYLAYCLGKSRSTKPDLFTMLVNAYKAKGIFLDNRPPATATTSVNGISRQGIKPPNTIGSAGQPSVPGAPARTKLDMNWDLFLNHEFIKDLQILVNFINDIGQKYYGRQYMVRIPEVRGYRDQEYTNSINRPGQTPLYVFAGTGKIYYNYELTDAAWEDPGNVIDDCIMVGDDKYQVLSDDRGMIPLILGYNNDDNIDYVRKKWCDVSFQAREQQLKSAIPPGTSPEAKKKQAILSNLISQNSFAADDECDKPIKFYKPTLDLSSQDYVEVEVNSKTSTFANPWEEPHPQLNYKSKKIYKKASSASLAFLDPTTFSGPRAIISTDPIFIKDTSYSYSKDPNLTVISNIALEDTIIYIKTKNNVSFNRKELAFFRYMMSYITPVIDGNSLVKEGNTSNQSANLQTISPKAAHPCFAGLPIKSNQYCYGPWSNHPFLDATRIFGKNVDAINVAENLIDNIKIEKKDEFAPWNFGGMSYLDKAVLYEIQDNTDYQSILEMGSVSIVGTPLYDIGGLFGSLAYTIPAGGRSPTRTNNNYLYNNSLYSISSTNIQFKDTKLTRPAFNITPVYSPLAFTPTILTYPVIIVNTVNNAFIGPVINNISMNVGVNGISTNYSFRTFSRKTGIWNKENVDRIKKENLNNIKLNKKISTSQNTNKVKLQQEIQSILNSSSNRSGPYGLAGFESKLFGSSPTEVLIGRSWPSAKNSVFQEVNSSLNNGARLNSKEPSKDTSSAPPPSPQDNQLILPYGLDPGDSAIENALWQSNPVSGVLSTKRFTSWVGMYMADEVGAELLKEYNNKAAMSLDGFFSPISFYPTQYNSTYSMSSYSNASGVFCPKCYGMGTITDTFVDPKNGVESELLFACPVCSKGKPVVSGEGDIHLYGLNPIVVPYGEFKNPNAQNSGNAVDRCRHSIQVVGRGEYNQMGDQSFHIPTNLNSYVNPDTGYEANGIGDGVLADYYEYDIFKKQTENLATNTQLNHRFFALRGPLMMHGWGYDTDGFPVPNSADEPAAIDAQGRPKRFIRKDDGTNDLEKDGAFLPTQGTVLGDVIGKGWERSGGKWKRVRSKKFYLNWAERQDTWPVGPIDIRWDDDRKVWTASGGCTEKLPPYVVASGTDSSVLSKFVGSKKTKCPYKMVYVTLEEDLVTEDGSDESYPSRAFLDDIQYAKTPLPASARRVVYVKDRCGYSAPRGSKLLCRYDGEYGFYEPVTKPNYIVFGTIIGGNRAVLRLSYIQGRKRGETIPTIQVAFDNTRFRFTINSRSSGSPTGMFLFENGKWILVAVN